MYKYLKCILYSILNSFIDELCCCNMNAYDDIHKL